MTQQAVAQAIREFLEGQAAETDADLFQFDTDLIDAGLVDSLLIVSLAAFCEERFGIMLELDELTEQNFRTIRALAALVSRRSDISRVNAGPAE